ncbi:MAG: hypothetical protein AAB922_00155 [Patescibacteria group bacterium]
MKIPKWLKLVEERDYLDFILRRQYDEIRKRPPIYKMIDEATGWDKKQRKEAKQKIARINEITKTLDNL